MRNQMSLVNKYFDDNIAKDYGVEEAIMFHNIQYWCEKNKTNNKNFHDGKYWTYNSMSSFQKLFLFWSMMQIRRILKNLEKNELIYVGNYNKVKFDKTKWYSINEKLYEHYHLFKPTNAIERTNNTIPNNKLSISKDIDADKSANTNKSQDSLLNSDTIILVQKFYGLVNHNFPFIQDRREELDKIEKDYKAFEKLLDRINDIKTIESVIDWCQNDKFWKKNVKRINVFVRKFDDLMVQSGIKPLTLKELYEGKIKDAIKLNSSLCSNCDKGYVVKNIDGYDKAFLCDCSKTQVHQIKKEYESKKTSLSKCSNVPKQGIISNSSR